MKNILQSGALIAIYTLYLKRPTSKALKKTFI